MASNSSFIQTGRQTATLLIGGLTQALGAYWPHGNDA